MAPPFGKEMNGKPRPSVVLSINWFNRKDSTITIVPGSTTIKDFKNLVLVRASPTNGLKNDTCFQCHHVRSIDKSRLVGGPIGFLSSDDLRRLEEAMAFFLGLSLTRYQKEPFQ